MSWYGEFSVFVIAATGAVAFVLAKYFHQVYLNSKPDIIDSATGLSSREKRLVQESWRLARKDLKASGTGLFFALFEVHPDYKKLFRAFADVPKEQLMKSGFFVAHAMNVANAVSLVVDTLDDVPSLVAQLKRIGRSHALHNITEKHFLNLNVVIVDFLESALGKNNFDAACRKSWEHTLEVALGVIKTELKG